MYDLGLITGNQCGLMLMLNKDQGAINSDIYRQHVVPLIH